MISGNKKYLISLYRTRSIVALMAGSIILCFTCTAIATALPCYSAGEVELFHYFTVLSAILSAAGAAFMIPFAVEGIRRKRFVLPKWVVLLQYSGTLCVVITFLSVLLVILPINGEDAVTGPNFWLHLVTPPLTFVLFQCVETDVSFRQKDTVVAQVPYWLYMIAYWIMVFLVGKGNGGWNDIYNVRDLGVPVWGISLIMLLAGWTIAVLLRLLHNYRARRNMLRLSRLWKEEMEPAELKLELFGLGRYMGQHCDGTEIGIPLDIFEMMARRYDVALPDLSRAYIKGVLDILNEKKDGEIAPSEGNSNRREHCGR